MGNGCCAVATTATRNSILKISSSDSHTSAAQTDLTTEKKKHRNENSDSASAVESPPLVIGDFIKQSANFKNETQPKATRMPGELSASPSPTAANISNIDVQKRSSCCSSLPRVLNEENKASAAGSAGITTTPLTRTKSGGSAKPIVAHVPSHPHSSNDSASPKKIALERVASSVGAQSISATCTDPPSHVSNKIKREFTASDGEFPSYSSPMLSDQATRRYTSWRRNPAVMTDMEEEQRSSVVLSPIYTGTPQRGGRPISANESKNPAERHDAVAGIPTNGELSQVSSSDNINKIAPQISNDGTTLPYFNSQSSKSEKTISNKPSSGGKVPDATLLWLRNSARNPLTTPSTAFASLVSVSNCQIAETLPHESSTQPSTTSPLLSLNYRHTAEHTNTNERRVSGVVTFQYDDEGEDEVNHLTTTTTTTTTVPYCPHPPAHSNEAPKTTNAATMANNIQLSKSLSPYPNRDQNCIREEPTDGTQFGIGLMSCGVGAGVGGLLKMTRRRTSSSRIQSVSIGNSNSTYQMAPSQSHSLGDIQGVEIVSSTDGGGKRQKKLLLGTEDGGVTCPFCRDTSDGLKDFDHDDEDGEDDTAGMMCSFGHKTSTTSNAPTPLGVTFSKTSTSASACLRSKSNKVTGRNDDNNNNEITFNTSGSKRESLFTSSSADSRSCPRCGHKLDAISHEKQSSQAPSYLLLPETSMNSSPIVGLTGHKDREQLPDIEKVAIVEHGNKQLASIFDAQIGLTARFAGDPRVLKGPADLIVQSDINHLSEISDGKRRESYDDSIIPGVPPLVRAVAVTSTCNAKDCAVLEAARQSTAAIREGEIENSSIERSSKNCDSGISAGRLTSTGTAAPGDLSTTAAARMAWSASMASGDHVHGFSFESADHFKFSDKALIEKLLLFEAKGVHHPINQTNEALSITGFFANNEFNDKTLPSESATTKGLKHQPTGAMQKACSGIVANVEEDTGIPSGISFDKEFSGTLNATVSRAVEMTGCPNTALTVVHGAPTRQTSSSSRRDNRRFGRKNGIIYRGPRLDTILKRRALWKTNTDHDEKSIVYRTKDKSSPSNYTPSTDRKINIPRFEKSYELPVATAERLLELEDELKKKGNGQAAEARIPSAMLTFPVASPSPREQERLARGDVFSDFYSNYGSNIEFCRRISDVLGSFLKKLETINLEEPKGSSSQTLTGILSSPLYAQARSRISKIFLQFIWKKVAEIRYLGVDFTDKIASLKSLLGSSSSFSSDDTDRKLSLANSIYSTALSNGTFVMSEISHSRFSATPTAAATASARPPFGDRRPFGSVQSFSSCIPHVPRSYAPYVYNHGGMRKLSTPSTAAEDPEAFYLASPVANSDHSYGFPGDQPQLNDNYNCPNANRSDREYSKSGGAEVEDGSSNNQSSKQQRQYASSACRIGRSSVTRKQINTASTRIHGFATSLVNNNSNASVLSPPGTTYRTGSRRKPSSNHRSSRTFGFDEGKPEAFHFAPNHSSTSERQAAATTTIVSETETPTMTSSNSNPPSFAPPPPRKRSETNPFDYNHAALGSGTDDNSIIEELRNGSSDAFSSPSSHEVSSFPIQTLTTVSSDVKDSNSQLQKLKKKMAHHQPRNIGLSSTSNKNVSGAETNEYISDVPRNVLARDADHCDFQMGTHGEINHSSVRQQSQGNELSAEERTADRAFFAPISNDSPLANDVLRGYKMVKNVSNILGPSLGPTNLGKCRQAEDAIRALRTYMERYQEQSKHHRSGLIEFMNVLGRSPSSTPPTLRNGSPSSVDEPQNKTVRNITQNEWNVLQNPGPLLGSLREILGSQEWIVAPRPEENLSECCTSEMTCASKPTNPGGHTDQCGIDCSPECSAPRVDCSTPRGTAPDANHEPEVQTRNIEELHLNTQTTSVHVGVNKISDAASPCIESSVKFNQEILTNLDDYNIVLLTLILLHRAKEYVDLNNHDVSEESSNVNTAGDNFATDSFRSNTPADCFSDSTPPILFRAVQQTSLGAGGILGACESISSVPRPELPIADQIASVSGLEMPRSLNPLADETSAITLISKIADSLWSASGGRIGSRLVNLFASSNCVGASSAARSGGVCRTKLTCDNNIPLLVSESTAADKMIQCREKHELPSDGNDKKDQMQQLDEISILKEKAQGGENLGGDGTTKDFMSLRLMKSRNGAQKLNPALCAQINSNNNDNTYLSANPQAKHNHGDEVLSFTSTSQESAPDENSAHMALFSEKNNGAYASSCPPPLPPAALSVTKDNFASILPGALCCSGSHSESRSHVNPAYNSNAQLLSKNSDFTSTSIHNAPMLDQKLVHDEKSLKSAAVAEPFLISNLAGVSNYPKNQITYEGLHSASPSASVNELTHESAFGLRSPETDSSIPYVQFPQGESAEVAPPLDTNDHKNKNLAPTANIIRQFPKHTLTSGPCCDAPCADESARQQHGIDTTPRSTSGHVLHSRTNQPVDTSPPCAPTINSTHLPTDQSVYGDVIQSMLISTSTSAAAMTYSEFEDGKCIKENKAEETVLCGKSACVSPSDLRQSPQSIAQRYCHPSQQGTRCATNNDAYDQRFAHINGVENPNDLSVYGEVMHSMMMSTSAAAVSSSFVSPPSPQTLKIKGLQRGEHSGTCTGTDQSLSPTAKAKRVLLSDLPSAHHSHTCMLQRFGDLLRRHEAETPCSTYDSQSDTQSDHSKREDGKSPPLATQLDNNPSGPWQLNSTAPPNGGQRIMGSNRHPVFTNRMTFLENQDGAGEQYGTFFSPTNREMADLNDAYTTADYKNCDANHSKPTSNLGQSNSVAKADSKPSAKQSSALPVFGRRSLVSPCQKENEEVDREVKANDLFTFVTNALATSFGVISSVTTSGSAFPKRKTDIYLEAQRKIDEVIFDADRAKAPPSCIPKPIDGRSKNESHTDYEIKTKVIRSLLTESIKSALELDLRREIIPKTTVESDAGHVDIVKVSHIKDGFNSLLSDQGLGTLEERIAHYCFVVDQDDETHDVIDESRTPNSSPLSDEEDELRETDSPRRACKIKIIPRSESNAKKLFENCKEVTQKHNEKVNCAPHPSAALVARRGSVASFSSILKANEDRYISVGRKDANSGTRVLHDGTFAIVEMAPPPQSRRSSTASIRRLMSGSIGSTKQFTAQSPRASFTYARVMSLHSPSPAESRSCSPQIDPREPPNEDDESVSGSSPKISPNRNTTSHFPHTFGAESESPKAKIAAAIVRAGLIGTDAKATSRGSVVKTQNRSGDGSEYHGRLSEGSRAYFGGMGCKHNNNNNQPPSSCESPSQSVAVSELVANGSFAMSNIANTVVFGSPLTREKVLASPSTTLTSTSVFSKERKSVFMMPLDEGKESENRQEGSIMQSDGTTGSWHLSHHSNQVTPRFRMNGHKNNPLLSTSSNGIEPQCSDNFNQHPPNDAAWKIPLVTVRLKLDSPSKVGTTQ